MTSIIYRFVSKPNLPDKDVKVVIMSGLHKIFCKKLETLGVNIIKTPAFNSLNTPEKNHADFSCHHLGADLIIIPDKLNNLREKLEKFGFSILISKRELKKDYPNNVLMNCARIDNKIVLNLKTADELIINYCKENYIELIHVNQGYTKCSTAVINTNSIITSDPTIYKAAIKIGMDVLKIQPGYIRLDGYDYGFIGGCCGFISKNKLAFTGNIKFHPEHKKIEKFITDRNIEIINLSDGELIDIGGILPVIEST